MIKGIVYRYISPDGKSYVGQTIRENMRKAAFSMMIKSSYRSRKLRKAVEEFGLENFTYEVLFSKNYISIKEAKTELLVIEEYYIKHFDSYNNGYNMTTGGRGPRGYKKTKEQIEPQRQWQIEYYKTHENPFKGKTHTEEVRKKIKRICKAKNW